MGKSPTKTSNKLTKNKKHDLLFKGVTLLQRVKMIPISEADLKLLANTPKSVYIGDLTADDVEQNVAFVSATNNNQVILRMGSKDFTRAFERFIHVMNRFHKNIPRNVQKMINNINNTFPNGGNSLFNTNLDFMKTFL